MGNTAVRTGIVNETDHDGAQRLVGVLSDGSAVVVVSELDDLYIYHSANRTAFVLKNTLNPANGPSSPWYPIAMAVDASDNLHLCWTHDSGERIYYQKLTFAAGPTWTPGTVELLVDDNDQRAGRIDIDCLDSGVVCIGFLDDNDDDDDILFKVWTRRSGGAWILSHTTNLGSAAGPYDELSVLSIARDAGGASGGVQKLAYICGAGQNRQSKLGVLSINLSSGVATNTVIDSNALGGYTSNERRQGHLYSSGANQWTFIGATGHSATGMTLWAFRMSATAYTAGPTSRQADMGYSLDSTFHANRTSAYITDKAVFFALMKAGTKWEIRGRVASFSGSTITWGSRFTYYQTTDNPYFVIGGSNRNFASGFADLIVSDDDDEMFVYNSGAVAPTVVGPTGQVTTDTPTLTAKLASNIPRVKAQWQVATDSGFTSNLRTITEPDADFRESGTANEVVPTASALFGGTWYVRARAIDEFGTVGAWSAPVSFSNSHVPNTTAHNPTLDSTRQYVGAGPVTFDWVFTDPSPVDTQTAFQVQIESNEDATSIVDTGQVMSAESTTTQDIPAIYKDKQLRWRVRVWDSDGTVGPYSNYHLFRVSDLPVVNVTAPAEASSITNPSPTVSWGVTLTGARLQANFRVTFYDAGDLTEIHNSGWVGGTVTDWIPPDSILQNGESYIVKVEVQDTSGLIGEDSNTFDVSFIVPTTPDFTVDVAPYGDDGYVEVEWTDANKDESFQSWRVYRRPQGTTTWTLIREDTSGGATFTYEDWLAASGVTYEYQLRQAAFRFGSIAESLANTVTVTPSSENYWLIHPDDNDLNTQLHIVTADGFTDEIEEETMNLIGRGRKRDYGTRWGYIGSLSLQLRDRPNMTARELRLRLELLREQRTELWLRNPFGDVWRVAPGDIAITRLPGVGQREFSDATIPYAEVA